MDVTVLIASYGNPSWIKLADRAAASVPSNIKYVRFHDNNGTLATVRNKVIEDVDTEYVCYLDADDEFEVGFFEAMSEGKADIRAPAVRYVNPNGTSYRPPMMPNVAGHTHQCVADCLIEGNWLVVGSVARTEHILRVGGWKEYEWSEDWDLWQRMWISGSTVESIPQAIYHAHVRTNSRNRSQNPKRRNQIHHEICRTNLPHLY